MAITFPVPLADFFLKMAKVSVQFTLPEVLESSRTAGGEVLTADLGTRLWYGTVGIAPEYHSEANEIEARLSILRQAGRSFLVSPSTKMYPRHDPDGLILGASTPTIHSMVGVRELKLTGLPSGYQVGAGDYLSFEYSGKYALHQVVVGGTASGAGVTGNLEVTPHIRPGATAGLAVKLVKPICKAVYIPGSHQVPTSEGPFTGGGGFSFVQTLR